MCVAGGSCSVASGAEVSVNSARETGSKLSRSLKTGMTMESMSGILHIVRILAQRTQLSGQAIAAMLLGFGAMLLGFGALLLGVGASFFRRR